MFNSVVKPFRSALLMMIAFSIITGIIYPLFITGIAQLFFPWRANGSLITLNEKKIGSELIGQSFNDPKYFFSRPSATTPFPYNAAISNSSSLGPDNPTLLNNVKKLAAIFEKLDPQNIHLIPVDLVTSSASGLDPEISPHAAFYQAGRISKLRGIPQEKIHTLIKNNIKTRTFGILGEPRVNVLELNIALDHLK